MLNVLFTVSVKYNSDHPIVGAERRTCDANRLCRTETPSHTNFVLIFYVPL